MKKIAIVTVKSINKAAARKLNIDGAEITVITENDRLTAENLRGAEYVFFPHWSRIIPKEIYENFKCVVFHMTDLPFGRGGSPLQNLIERGITDTVISAIQVTGVLDGGAVYMKCPLNLNGGAEEIFIRVSETVFGKMIPAIVNNNIIPIPQQGETVVFKRRTPEMSEIKPDFDLRKIFDYIRMLDAEGYPPAFIKFGKYKIRFSRPKLTEGEINADVTITEAE